MTCVVYWLKFKLGVCLKLNGNNTTFYTFGSNDRSQTENFYDCQAKPKHQVKHRLKAELTLFSFDPETHTKPPVNVYFQHITVKVDQVTLHKCSRIQIGRQPQLFGK
jgi:hypothetical protein